MSERVIDVINGTENARIVTAAVQLKFDKDQKGSIETNVFHSVCSTFLPNHNSIRRLCDASGSLLSSGSRVDYHKFFHWLFRGEDNFRCGESRLHSRNSGESRVQYTGWLSHLELGELLPIDLLLEFGEAGLAVRGRWKVLKNDRFALHAWTAAFDHPMFNLAAAECRGGWSSVWSKDSALPAKTAVAVDFDLDTCRGGTRPSDKPMLNDGAGLCGTLRRRLSGTVVEVPVPVASWNFRRPAEEQIYEPHRPGVQCQRGVTWEPQGLVFDKSVDCYFLTEPINLGITEKTLEVCFQLFDLDQLSTGIISFGLMDDASAAFDSLTYNQRRPHQWINCSNFFCRTVNVDGLAETSMELLHMVVTYSANGFVSIYRNGVPYGSPYKVDRQLTIPSGHGRLLLGARHVWPGPTTSLGVSGVVGLADGHQLAGPLDGRITYAALYDTALTAEQVALRAGTGSLRLWVSVEKPLSGPTDLDYLLVLRRAFPPHRRCSIENPAKRCITVAHLQRVLLFAIEHCHKWTGKIHRDGTTSNEQLSMGVLNLYHVDKWLIRPCTSGVLNLEKVLWDCSFVELLGRPMNQQTFWFVSHWWGEPILDFLKCAQHHAFLRGLSENSYYWICAYANRQHRLGDDMGGQLVQTSFYKAISASVGVLVMLDENATAFSRIWCTFEEYIAMKCAQGDRQLIVDIANCNHGEPKLLAGTETEYDKKDMLPTYHKADRENSFPGSVIAKSLGFDILAAKASVPSDRETILTWMRDSEENGVERAGRRLRSYFSIAAWRHCVVEGKVEAYDLATLVREDEDRSEFVFDFSFLRSFSDTDAETLASAMHTGIRRIDLNFEWCINLSTGGLGRLAACAAACSGLEALTLNLRECVSLDGACIAAFLGGLPASIRELHLKYHKKATHHDCVQLGDAIARLLALPLRSLHLSFRDCLELNGTAIVSALGGLTSSTQLATCELSFQGCNIDDELLGTLVNDNLPLESLENLCFNVRYCHGIGVPGILAFGERLRNGATRLQRLSLVSDVLEAGSAKELADWCWRARARSLSISELLAA